MVAFFWKFKYIIIYKACSCFTVLLLLFQNEQWAHTLKHSGIQCKKDLSYIKLFRGISILFICESHNFVYMFNLSGV